MTKNGMQFFLDDLRDALGLKCFVYFNLHKKCFSVKALEGPSKGRVVAHADMVYMENCIFKVSEAGRRRVLREKRKNVHAGIVGVVRPFPVGRNFALNPRFWDMSDERAEFLSNPSNYVGVKYNPYQYRTFVKADNPAVPVASADICWLDAYKRSIGAINPNYEVDY